ncbi:MAG: FadR family transcriptional regulator [Alphaproteobacteria bacterium]|jgi:GntR family transcriptional regulator, transcriptional repressor for pyruvate dehydrogenase complex|nr:FadR family transcriptional regulator [Alphaproteobacteria bacterium]
MHEIDTQEFQPIKKRRLSDEVTAQIRARIVAGELRPGDKLPAERDMASNFAVSRGAVREAVRGLELAGVVNVLQGVTGGAYVGEGNPGVMEDSLKDLFYLGGVSLQELTDARIWIETLVTRLACERGTDEDFAALKENVEEANTLLKQGHFNDKIDVHVEFHNILARATHNPVMIMLMRALMELMREFSHKVGGEKHDLTIRARRKFLKHLANRDANKAAAAMEQHLKQLQKRYAGVVQSRQPETEKS